ncbi:molybdate ABC transporter substrate-binding protein [Portibacter marinus]|uniref:molybdate ABC transporter substrate-binding protein n=1 Tax=Portibacter marinus TaxID=2898660 RepID=UPI001F39A241|nr:molybdate ABC transporter substrate-binding protein [Portibacter marinus]
MIFCFRRIHVVIILLSITILLSCDRKEADHEQLLVFCAAVMKPVMEKVVDVYESKFDVKIAIQYGGSGTLLSNIRVSKQGDLYLAADESFVVDAERYDLIANSVPLAHIYPVIVVKKGNPKNVHTLEDLLRNDVDVVLANPEAASIGRQTKQILEQKEMFSKIEKKVVAFVPTVSEVANSIKLGTSDAGIVWNAMLNHYDDLQAVEMASLQEESQNVSIALLKHSRNKSGARHFIAFISNDADALQIFADLEYKKTNDH